MTSQVNPNLIDEQYPVAGQDNDSQGFRDNFNNIKNNLSYIKDELEDLQAKVVLKEALTGTTLDNDMSVSGTTLDETTLSGNTFVTGTVWLNGAEDLANAGAASLRYTTSYFTTGSAETATLAAGHTGQIKTFMMVGDSGDMVITVTNAGWKSSGTGTITFNDIGDACTLQYMASKWFCIGNNGCTFA
jgi:hypothetical protein